MNPFLTCSSAPHRLHRSSIASLRRTYHRRRIWAIYARLKPWLRDMRCLRMLVRSYGEQRGLDVEATDARMIFYYGMCSIGEPWSLRGADLDAHFDHPVLESVEHVNSYFRERLDELLASV